MDNGKNRPISLRRIAKEMNLSVATVSWTLSGQGDAKGISAATQKRVRDFAAEHNYRPDMIARSLSLGVTKTIGLLISSLSDPFYSSIAKAVSSEAERFGYSVMIASSESQGDRESRLLEMFASYRVDGMIVTPTLKASWSGSLAAAGRKIVMVDRPAANVNAPSVVVDNEQSAYCLVKHLINKGMRRIAILTTAHNLTNMRARHAGYIRALFEAGIEPDAQLMCQVPPSASRSQIYAELDRLMRECRDVDGIFFTSHVLVMPTYVYLRDRAHNPGRGENWACIHTLAELEELLPEMSIAKMPIDELGTRAMDTLLELMNPGSDSSVADVVLGCEMKLR